jgi:hypothetical protein
MHNKKEKTRKKKQCITRRKKRRKEVKNTESANKKIMLTCILMTSIDLSFYSNPTLTFFLSER